MPTKYTLNCHIDERWVHAWAGDDGAMKFCFGKNVTADQVGVAAYVGDIAQSITVQWEDDYLIAASRNSLEPGAVVTSTTNYVPIDFGQKYVVDKTWAPGNPVNSDQAPKNGFLFQNTNIPAAAILAKKINGQVSPFYTSPVLLPPAGSSGGDALIPAPNVVAVWFQMDVKSGTMIDRNSGEKFLVTMDTTSKSLSFTSDGAWSIST